MDRRQSLLAVSALAGHALFPDVLAGFGRALAAPTLIREPWRPEYLTVGEGRLVGMLAETILPKTDTPGALEAGVHLFVDLFLKHCRTAAEQEAFRRGLAEVEAECREAHGVAFADADREHREALLRAREAKADPFLRGLKEMAVLGYCTSQPGATAALAYVAVPGAYRGCVPLEPGQKGWAT
jgi:hypothetical protein